MRSFSDAGHKPESLFLGREHSKRGRRQAPTDLNGIFQQGARMVLPLRIDESFARNPTSANDEQMWDT